MYQEAIVTFIDILGFGDFVKKSDFHAVQEVLYAVKDSLRKWYVNSSVAISKYGYWLVYILDW